MNLYGFEGSVASLSKRRNTRTPGGVLTDREYRLTTMLTESGDIYALGESDIIDQKSGQRLRKASQVTIPRDALDDAEHVWAVLDPYFDHLDRAVESAIPRLIEE